LQEGAQRNERASDVGLRKLPEMAFASYLGLRAEILYSSRALEIIVAAGSFSLTADKANN
jgi:hypothetical protein